MKKKQNNNSNGFSQDNWGVGNTGFDDFGSNNSDGWGSNGTGNDGFSSNDVWGQPDIQPGTEKKQTLCISLTVLSVLCALLAMLISYLLRDVDRNVPLFGLSYALPTTLLMLFTLFLEKQRSVMNPRYSYNRQRIVALCVAVAAFITGCAGEFVHEITTYTPANYIIVLDKSGSMYGTRYDQCADAVIDLMEQMPDRAELGYVAFDDEVLDYVSIGRKADNLSDIVSGIHDGAIGGGTDFYLPLSKALDMISNTKIPTRILLLTDGEDSYFSGSTIIDEIVNLCSQKNASISTILVDTYGNSALNDVVSKSGGMSVFVDDASLALQGIQDMQFLATDQDLLHSVPMNQRDKWITIVMYLVLGLLIGVGLHLMLSRKTQKRLQPILSPVLAVLGVVVLYILSIAKLDSLPIWTREGIAQALPLLVFMKKNA